MTGPGPKNQGVIPQQQVLNVDSTLNVNRKVPFVDRIINAPKYPVRKNKDGSVSTHLMASASDDQGAFAYPTLRLVNGQWVENKNPRSAMQAGDYIRFKSDSDADYFARNYKTSKLSTVKTFKNGGRLPMRKLQFGGPGDPIKNALSPLERNPAGVPGGVSSYTPPPGFAGDSNTAGDLDPVVVGNSLRSRVKEPVDQVRGKWAVRQIVPNVTAPKTGSKVPWGKIGDEIAPYASNISNAFRNPPMPAKPLSQDYVSMQRVNLNNERAAVDRSVRNAGVSTDRNIDGNSAEAVKAATRGQGFEQRSQINEREMNANSAIANSETQLNANIAAGNIGRMQKFNDETVERGVAIQREQSANIANASDKYGAIKNEREKRATELEKARVLGASYEKSGVLRRARMQMKARGEKDPMDMDYSDLEEKASGGFMTRRSLPSKMII